MRTTAPQNKEIGQALSLIAQYGTEETKYIVEYAASKAVETSFKIQHFGAILSYASRAVAAFSRQAQLARSAPVVQAEALQDKKQRWARGEGRLACLIAEQYEHRFDKSKAELLEQSPFLTQHWGPRSGIQMVRTRMIRDLDSEPMDLIVIGRAGDPEVLRQNLGLQNLGL